jgi:hypothetical protein
MEHPRSACGASPSRGRTRRPGKAGSAGDMKHPRSACGASPSRGRTPRPGKAGSAGRLKHPRCACGASPLYLSDLVFSVVVGGCGQVVRGLRGGQREALSTASKPVRAKLELSTCPQPGPRRSFVVDAPNLVPLWAFQPALEPLVNASSHFVQPCSPNSCQ